MDRVYLSMGNATNYNHISVCDCLHLPLVSQSVDLVFCSPPYEDARAYDMEFKLHGRAWVDWAVPRFLECLRVCRGLVAWVVAGRTRKFEWSATPAMLMVALKEQGAFLRNPAIFHRAGIPGSGGPDWLRSDYEWIVCATAKRGRLLWSDNTAMGSKSDRRLPGEMDVQTRRKPNGKRVRDGLYRQPNIANPGNVIHCKVGGGLMGSRLAHDNEAPFPESLAEFFVKSFCPPTGIVLDPFSGSGTTVAVSERLGRQWIAYDIRESQCELTRRRIEEARNGTGC